jgi:hypothetical protein
MFELESTEADDVIEDLVRTTERYCVVFQTLASRPELSVARR